MQVTLGEVILSARDKLLTERPELFMKDKSVYVPALCIYNRDVSKDGVLQLSAVAVNLVLALLHRGSLHSSNNS